MNSLVVFSSIPISATKLENTNPINNREQQEKTVQHDPKNKNQNQANKKPDKLRVYSGKAEKVDQLDWWSKDGKDTPGHKTVLSSEQGMADQTFRMAGSWEQVLRK